MNKPTETRTHDDVRNDPQVGDVIMQNRKFRIEVVQRDGDRVEWVEGKRNPKKWNSWTVWGWREVVCRGALIVNISQGENNGDSDERN